MYPFTIQQSVYLTPRALLIHYLNDDFEDGMRIFHDFNDENVANWITKNETFEADLGKLNNIWQRTVRPSMVGDRRFDDVNYYFFMTNYYAAIEDIIPLRPRSSKQDFTIVTKASQKRKIVDDLKIGNLHELLIRFLLEQTRTDCVDWVDKNTKAFRIYDMTGISQMYAMIHDNITDCSLYCIKLLLSSYCRTGILIQIDKKSNIYQFNNEWYSNEIYREMEVVITEDDVYRHNTVEAKSVESWVQFPEQTLYPWDEFDFL